MGNLNFSGYEMPQVDNFSVEMELIEERKTRGVEKMI
jgi:hypothetical protein